MAALSPKPNAYSHAKRIQLEQEADRFQRLRAQQIIADNSRLVELALEKEKRHHRLLREVLPRPTHSSLCHRRRAKRTVSESEALGGKLAVRTVERDMGNTGSPFKEVEAKSNVYEAELLKELEELASSEEIEEFMIRKEKKRDIETNFQRKSASMQAGQSHYSPSPPRTKVPTSPSRIALSPQFVGSNLSESPPLFATKRLNRSVQPRPFAASDKRQERLEKSIHDLNLKLEKLKTARTKRSQGPRIRHVSLPGMELPVHRKYLALR